MAVIYNFNELSKTELQQFAAGLVQKINSESLFTSEVDFKIEEIDTDEMSGDLIISLSHDDLIEISRKATWQCGDEDELYSTPYDPEFEDNIYTEIEQAFKTTTIELDGYKLSLTVDDIDEEEILEADVDSYSHEDSGIGHYEFWGEVGYDSRPYLEVEGSLIVSCSCYISLWVEPIK